MNNQTIIDDLVQQVKTSFEGAEGGHDWWHTYRVWQTAQKIAKTEKSADQFVVYTAALLHDIADPKFHNGDEEIGPRTAHRLLHDLGVDGSTIEHVVNIIRHISFKNSFDQPSFDSIEMRIVQDADRLDAMGAIGIARAFNYGGYKNQPFYDPLHPPNLKMTKDEYKKRVGPTINHFYVKLLRLKDMMHTQVARKMAEQRHRFMEQYLEQFYREWGDSKKWT